MPVFVKFEKFKGRMHRKQCTTGKLVSLAFLPKPVNSRRLATSSDRNSLLQEPGRYLELMWHILDLVALHTDLVCQELNLEPCKEKDPCQSIMK